jgi:hypothetical protein
MLLLSLYFYAKSYPSTTVNQLGKTMAVIPVNAPAIHSAALDSCVVMLS